VAAKTTSSNFDIPSLVLPTPTIGVGQPPSSSHGLSHQPFSTLLGNGRTTPKCPQDVEDLNKFTYIYMLQSKQGTITK